MIFQTNLRTAHAAGRWAQIERLKKQRPYIRYVSVGVQRVRPLHKQWHGTVLPVDDPWWRTHFPPCGWNCRCSVQSLSERDLKRFGHKVSPSAPASPVVTKQISTPHGPVGVKTPVGIDPGFAYNPGIAWLGNPLPTRLDDRGVWPPLDLPGRPPPSLPRLKPQTVPRDAEPQLHAGETPQEGFKRLFGADEAVLTDPLGTAVHVGPSLVDYLTGKTDGRARFIPLLRSLIENPAEIWTGFETVPGTGRVVLKRRYVRVFDLGNGRGLIFVAQFDRGRFEAFNLIPKDLRGINTNRARGGYLAWRDEEQVEP